MIISHSYNIFKLGLPVILTGISANIFDMKEIGFEKILGEPGEALFFLQTVSTDASHRLMYRVFAEDQNLSIKDTPVGGEDGLDKILSFMPIAKEGFTLNLRTEDVTFGQIRDLLDITTPTNLADMLTGLNIRIKMKVEKKNVSLALFRHTLATLSILSRARKVDSTVIKEGLSGISYWPPQLDPENVWRLLDEIEDTTRSMILDKDLIINKSSAIRATHFFVVGGQLAKSYR